LELKEEKQTEINDLFNILLKSDEPNQGDVEKFFSDLLCIDFSHDDGEKLTIFFQENKKELAHCFCDKQLSKEKLESLFSTLWDGCFANIAMQFKKMLYAAMIKDEDAQILYAVADDKIFSGIINSHGSDIMDDNSGPIDNKVIKSYLLSPMALVKKLSKEEMLTSAKSWDIIGKNTRDDYHLIERLEVYKDTSESKYNKKTKKIASFLIIKEIVGEEKMLDLVHKNPQLKELRDFIYGRVSEPLPSLQQSDSPSSSLKPRDDLSELTHKHYRTNG
jgi:hypothetical protein